MLTNKVALISGAASGIGLAAAQILCQKGAHVYIADIKEQAAIAAAQSLSAQGLLATGVSLDVTSAEQWQRTIAQIDTEQQRLDVLVNNAGLGEGSTMDDDLELFNRVMNVNVNGVFLGCKYAIPLMAQSGGGSVINISSIYGIVADSQTLAYSTSKGAVRSMTKSLALDCAERNNGVRVNSLHPGFVETPMVINGISALPADVAEEYTARTIGLTPLGRIGQPHELGNVIAFLASDDSSFMTGSEVVVDGGFTAR